MTPSRRAHSLSEASDASDIALDFSMRILEISKDIIADAASVPGVGVALGAAISILKRVQEAKSNHAAIQSLVEETKSLAKTLVQLGLDVKAVLDRCPAGSSNTQAKEEIGFAKLIEGTTKLASRLENISDKAHKLSKRTCVGRFLHSAGDAQTIVRMKEEIRDACQTFQMEVVVKTQANVNGIMARQWTEEEERVLASMVRVDGALYGSAVNAMKARLQEGTRERILASLMEWVDAQSQNKGGEPVCVLVGEAGTGKSTIASELSKLLEENRLLGASYFFTRGLPDLNATTKVFPTIAWQLAQSHPDLRRPVIDGAREHHQRGDLQQLQRQFEDLIDKPLRCLSPHHPPIFVVLDGVDECTEEGPQLVPAMLRLLLSAAVRPGSPLRIFLASRPEPQYIHDVVDEFMAEHHISLMAIQDFRNTADNDIDRFIRARLTAHKTSEAWLHTNPYIVNTLVAMADGLFIYAETVVSFILDGLHGIWSMQDRYASLGTETALRGLPALDRLYHSVLGDVLSPAAESPPEVWEALKRVLEYLVALQDRDGISPATLEQLTGMSTAKLVPILNKLRSLIVFERDNVNSRFRIIHATFREFLVDRSRAGDAFYVSLEEAHGRLANECTGVLRSFREEYSYGIVASATLILQFIKQSPTLLHFRYACEFSDEHHRLGNPAPQDPESPLPVIELPPIPAFTSYMLDHGHRMMWDLICALVEQLRGSLPAGSELEAVVSSVDNFVQHGKRMRSCDENLIYTVSIILDIQAIATHSDASSVVIGTTSFAAATMGDRRVNKELANALKEALRCSSLSIAFQKTHQIVHQAIVAAGHKPGHQYEDEVQACKGSPCIIA